MKTRIMLFALAIIAVAILEAIAQDPPIRAVRPSVVGRPETIALSSFDIAGPSDERMARAAISFEKADVAEILKLYQELSHRSVIRSMTVPNVAISFVNEAPVTRVEALQALDTVLAANGITMVYLGSSYVKAVPSKEAPAEAAPVIELAAEQLPESSSYLTYMVRLKNRTPEEVIAALQPFAKMPNSIVAMKGGEMLILRDYSINVRLMLKVLAKLEQAPRAPEAGRERPRGVRQ
jgi:type II secretory pathway component GspD/PulD (secretin)